MRRIVALLGKELTDLRQRLDKAKRRAFAAQEEKSTLDARIAVLESELRDREGEAKRLRDEVARLEGRLEDAGRDTARLRDESARVVAERDRSLLVALRSSVHRVIHRTAVVLLVLARLPCLPTTFR